jgi:hypothetical protein
LLAAIKKMPAGKLKQLKSVLDEGFIGEKAGEQLSDFQNYLLKGPVMNARQFRRHQQVRKNLNQWSARANQRLLCLSGNIKIKLASTIMAQ